MSMTESIIQAHESICYSCLNSRRVAADKLEQEGYVGCCMWVKGKSDRTDFIDEASELAEGWVDLKSKPFGNPSGVITNIQLITLEVKSCTEYKTIENK